MTVLGVEQRESETDLKNCIDSRAGEAYTGHMERFFGLFLGFGMLATLLVLVIGIVSFAVHGPFYLRHSNHLMRLRVLFQGIAVGTLAIIVYMTAK